MKIFMLPKILEGNQSSVAEPADVLSFFVVKAPDMSLEAVTRIIDLRTVREITRVGSPYHFYGRHERLVIWGISKCLILKSSMEPGLHTDRYKQIFFLLSGASVPNLASVCETSTNFIDFCLSLNCQRLGAI